MKINWVIDPDDIDRVRDFYEKHLPNHFVKLRIERNLRAEKPEVTKDEIWDCLVGCLLTTQQRSGPNTPVTRFIQQRPFPLAYRLCLAQGEFSEFARLVLGVFGGLRMSTKISGELATNLNFFERGG
jgi:hypothetical protein